MRRTLGVVLVLVLILAGCGDDDESAVVEPRATEQQTATATEPATPEPQAAPATDATAEADDASGVWDPILATTRAREAPPAASCPDGTDPDAVGPRGQKRPVADWVGNLAAAFDTDTGRVVYVDKHGATWTFDVCTNTWELMSQAGALREGFRSSGLVYDVDSGVTVAMGGFGVAVYDSTTNTWTESPYIDGPRGSPWGVVYDPVSGLILANAPTPVRVGGANGLWAFDVDTGRWSLVGTVHADDGPLLGYAADIDRLVFGDTLVDPRTGATAPVDGSVPRVAGGFGDYIAGTDAHTTYIQSDDGAICRFDPATTRWSDCHTITGETRTDFYFSAIVGDPINDRLVLPNAVYGNWWVNAVDTVWAMEPDTATWRRLLAPSTPEPDDNQAVFSFADDDLCEWVTEDEVAQFVAAEFDWDGTATKVGSFGGEACRWELSGADSTNGSVFVIDGGLSEQFGGDPYDYDAVMEDAGVLDYQGHVCIGEFVAGHPALSDGVVVHNGGFGQFAFAVPGDTEWLLLYLEVPGRTGDDWTSCAGTTGGVASEDYEPRYFAVVDHFLEELGWLSAR